MMELQVAMQPQLLTLLLPPDLKDLDEDLKDPDEDLKDLEDLGHLEVVTDHLRVLRVALPSVDAVVTGLVIIPIARTKL